MNVRIDKLDRQIIDLLQHDGRMPATEVASRLGVSARTVRFRIDRLVNSGVMVVSAWVDVDRVGLPVTATVTVRTMPHLVRGIAERLAVYEEITYVAMHPPAGTIVLSVVGASGPDTNDVVDRLVRPLPGVQECHVFVETVFLKDLASWYPRVDEGE
jgi:Lrp/AsnC family transcriptional regulator, regulator for asnA, asnC and gidA